MPITEGTGLLLFSEYCWKSDWTKPLRSADTCFIKGIAVIYSKSRCEVLLLLIFSLTKLEETQSIISEKLEPTALVYGWFFFLRYWCKNIHLPDICELVFSFSFFFFLLVRPRAKTAHEAPSVLNFKGLSNCPLKGPSEMGQDRRACSEDCMHTQVSKSETQ